MIVVCEKCKTTFHLDERIIKKPVSKVRCSKCKHIFYIGHEKEEIYDLHAVAHPVKGKVIAICNQKGGVAKTSTCLSLAASLGSFDVNRRILLIDFDPQSNLSLILGKKNYPSFYEVYQKEITLLKAIQHINKNLSLLPASSKIALLAKQSLHKKDFGFLLRDTLQPIKQDFDYLFIDTPPSIKFFTPNALMAAHFVVIPTQSEFLSMNGVMQMESIIQAISPTHSVDYKILITLYDERNTASKVVYKKFHEKYGNKLFRSHINLDYKMQESQIVNDTILSYDAYASSALQYLEVAKELEAVV